MAHDSLDPYIYRECLIFQERKEQDAVCCLRTDSLQFHHFLSSIRIVQFPDIILP